MFNLLYVLISISCDKLFFNLTMAVTVRATSSVSYLYIRFKIEEDNAYLPTRDRAFPPAQ